MYVFTGGPLYLRISGFHIGRFNQVRIENIWKKFQKAKLEFANNYLHSIYIVFATSYITFTVLGIINNLEMI